MSLEALKKTILQEAQEEADAVAARLKEQQSSERQRILQRAQQMEEDIIGRAEREAALVARRRRQETELHARALVLRAKEEELQETQKQLLAKLLEEDPKPLLTALLKLVPEEKGIIHAGEHHAKAMRELVKHHDIAAKTLPGDGGFTFTGKKAELNVTLSHLVASVFRKHRTAIASTLFS